MFRLTVAKKSESSEIDFKADVIAFACGELGIMPLADVYDMTFAEFQIRLFAYKRIQLREWEKVRMIAWSAFIGSHQDPKTMPKTIDSFMNLGDNSNKSKVSEAQKERFLNAMSEYLKQANNG